MKKKTLAKEIVVDVTEKEYRADLAKGLREDEVLKPGRHTFKRGGFLARHGLTAEQAAKQTKVRISIHLDLDVLNYFKERAAQSNAAPYQTQINNTLREVMERGQPAATKRRAPPAETLLTDPQFIKAVAEQVAAFSAAPPKRSRQAAIKKPASQAV